MLTIWHSCYLLWEPSPDENGENLILGLFWEKRDAIAAAHQAPHFDGEHDRMQKKLEKTSDQCQYTFDMENVPPYHIAISKLPIEIPDGMERPTKLFLSGMKAGEYQVSIDPNMDSGIELVCQ